VYRYRCQQCATTSPPVRTRVEAERDRDWHRRAAHGGHIPDGERLQRSTRSAAGDRTAMVALAVLAAILLLSLAAGRMH
jgi:hypothetical protein